MKKIILTALVAVASLSANAQVWIGGELGFNYEKVKNVNKETSISIAPEVGYKLSDKWDIAIGLGFGFENFDPEVGSKIKTTTIGVNPYARYTFAKAGIASFFVDGGFNVAHVTEDHKNVDKVEATTWGIGVQPGVAIALSPKASLVGKLGYLGYQNTTYKDDAKAKVSDFGLGVNGNNISLGFYYAF